MTVLYPNLCYKELWPKGTVLFIQNYQHFNFTLLVTAYVIKVIMFHATFLLFCLNGVFFLIFEPHCHQILDHLWTGQ